MTYPMLDSTLDQDMQAVSYEQANVRYRQSRLLYVCAESVAIRQSDSLWVKANGDYAPERISCSKIIRIFHMADVLEIPNKGTQYRRW